jgi:pimeloyl-ACP methyl ester carboxylesterase
MLYSSLAPSPSEAPSVAEREIRPDVFEGYWTWEGHRIRYQRSGSAGPAVLLVHGFGANADHWRNNIGPLAQNLRVFAIDLLGFGYSDKPVPCKQNPNTVYNFEAWGRQCADFIQTIIREPAFVVTNSVGGVTGMQTALDAPRLVRGVILMNVSLRMLHESKQPPLAKPLIKAFQTALRTTVAGKFFFDNLATPKTLQGVLKQAYSDPTAVTDELVDVILRPGLQPGALDVFLDFISYSTGPLPEAQLTRLSLTNCPVRILWGEDDPWEKVEWGRGFRKYPCVEDFIALPGVGHCPHDEAPDLVNPLIEEFVRRHATAAWGVV